MRTANRIASRIAERSRRRPRERLRIEPEILIGGRPVRERLIADVRIADEIPRLVRRIADAGAIVVQPHRPRLSRLEDRGAGHLPAAERLRSKRVLIAPERQLVDVVHVEDVRAIVVRHRPVRRRIVRVEHDVALV